MAQPTLKYKDELTTEPDYNGSDNEVGSSTQSCPYADEDPKQKILSVHFEDKDGKKIQNISKEEEVELIVETENMEGEELVLGLGDISDSLKLEDESLSKLKVLLFEVGSSLMKTTLKVLPIRLKNIEPDKPREEEVDTPKTTKSEVAKIESIEFLDGDDVKTVGEKVAQFVNIPQEDKWVDGTDVKNKDRLSNRPRIFIKFDTEGSHKVKIKWKGKGSNLNFSDGEKTRNARFEYDAEEKEYTTEIDGTLIVDDFKLSIACGDEFRVEATDDQGEKVKSKGTLIVKKLFYLTEIKMRGLTAIASNVDALVAEYARNNIVIAKLADVTVDRMENLSDSTDTNLFKASARTGYLASGGPAKEPYSMTVSYTESLAAKACDQEVELTGVDVGSGKPKVKLDIEGPGVTNPATAERQLWKDIVTGEDWFVSCTFLKDGGTAADLVEIDQAKCTPKQKPGYPTGYFVEVAVDVDDLDAETGTLTLTVHWVDRWRAGLAGAGNFTCVCTKAFWQTSNTAKQNQVMIHEIGHKVGMASKGIGKLPDKIDSFYKDDQGHRGPHCYKGIPDGQARYDSSADHALSTCVMYGSTNGVTKFCSNCQPAVRKTDLLVGWTAF